MKQLKQHFQRILDEGKDKPNRKGEFDQGDSTLSVFGAQLRFSLRDSTLPVTTSKELKFQSMAKEITWMLRGETNTKTLGCGIWDKWALQEDLVIRRAKSEHEVIMELSRKDPTVNINELSLQLFNLVLKNTTIKEGATLKVNTSQAEGGVPEVWEDVPATKENITPFNMNQVAVYVDDEPQPGLDIDYDALDEDIRAMGVEPYNIIPQFDAGYCGPIYGKQWREFESVVTRQGRPEIVKVDQFMEAYRMLRNDPYSRRNIVSAWNPGLITESGIDLKTNIALGNMGLPPCHYGMQFYVSGQGEDKELSLLLKLRSSDSGLGLPFNIASYAFIAYIYAAEFNLKLGDLVVHIGDAHIYKSHIEGIKEYIARPEHELPKFNFIEKYKDIKTRVCVDAINAKVDQLTYDSEDDRNEAADNELIKYFGGDVDETPAGKEALFQLFLDNLDYTVLTECIKDYVCEPHIKLPLYD